MPLNDDLRRLGLKKNETTVYAALFELGTVTAGELIKRTGLHRNLVYTALENLVDRRLVSKKMRKGVAAFFTNDPLHFLESIREQELVAEALVEKLRARRKFQEQEIVVYEGEDGIRAYCLKNAESLHPGEDIHVIGTGGRRLEKAMGEQALKKYFRLIEQNGGIRVIAYEGQQYTKEMYEATRGKEMFKFKVIQKRSTPAAGVIFTNDSVGFVIYEGSPAVIEVKNTYLVDAYKEYFEILWNQSSTPQATLIVLHGHSATGKSTLGKAISQRLNLPFFSKDVFKEAIFEALHVDVKDVHWSRQVGGASLDALYVSIESLLAANKSLVVETYWNPARDSSRIRSLSERYDARIVQIFCHAEFNVLKKRFMERAQTDRHPAHMDLRREFKEDTDRAVPLDLPGPCIYIDTTDFASVDVDTILAQLRSVL
jgi:predicted kinase/predicted DNA-binding transcriptional regulator